MSIFSFFGSFSLFFSFSVISANLDLFFDSEEDDFDLAVNYEELFVIFECNDGDLLSFSLF